MKSMSVWAKTSTVLKGMGLRTVAGMALTAPDKKLQAHSITRTASTRRKMSKRCLVVRRITITTLAAEAERRIIDGQLRVKKAMSRLIGRIVKG